ncbi:hypothetical protein DK853_37660, partial [Klebsiella oxytoca]
MPNRDIEEAEGKVAMDALVFMPPEDKRRGQFPHQESNGELSQQTFVFAGSGIMLSSMANRIGK